MIMAAGLGSRYGGIKQLERIGPNGECIMEYSIYDAIKTGFEKLVFVIKKSFEKDFTQKISSKWEKFIEIKHVFQEIDEVPESFKLPPNRQKPWGTGHAVLSSRQVIHEAFTVINADDFYGRGAFKAIADHLKQKNISENEHCLVAYRLSNTLSDFGSVSRGICTVENDYLTSINEATHITKNENLIYNKVKNKQLILSDDTLVSMNFWGFKPSIFNVMVEAFEKFLFQKGDDPNAEFFIAYPLDMGLKNKTFSIKVLKTKEKWMGVTYPEDKKNIQNGVLNKVQSEVYPMHLIDSL